MGVVGRLFLTSILTFEWQGHCSHARNSINSMLKFLFTQSALHNTRGLKARELTLSNRHPSYITVTCPLKELILKTVNSDCNSTWQVDYAYHFGLHLTGFVTISYKSYNRGTYFCTKKALKEVGNTPTPTMNIIGFVLKITHVLWHLLVLSGRSRLNYWMDDIMSEIYWEVVKHEFRQMPELYCQHAV